MPKISIITPSFNQAPFMEAALESVHSQKGPFELEHIVIDGGSTDGTVDILRKFGHDLRWISEKDNGQADAINKGLAMATGDVIGWLNSDDLYESGAFATIAEIFGSEPQTQWLYGKVRIVDDQGAEIRRWITAYKNFRMRKWSYKRLLAENWISQMGVFWRKSAGEQAGPLRADLHWTMDYEFWLRLGSYSPGRFVNRYLADFRWYPTSKSGSGFSQQFGEGLEVAKSYAGNKHKWPIICHRMHAAKTVAIYNLLSRLRKPTNVGVNGDS